MHKVYKESSFFSKIVNFFLRIINYKKRFTSVENIEKHITKINSKNRKYNLPKELGFIYEQFEGMDIYIYNKKIKDNQKVLLYFHGGAYVENACYLQLKSVMNVAKKSNSILVFPIYPLAPKGDYKTAYKLMENLYSKIIKENKRINVIGDSAGGGFALSFSMYLKEKGMMQPDNIIMLSPWLDISLSNSKINDYEKKDIILASPGAKYCGKLWKDELSDNNFLISPLYGDCNNLGKMTIIVGGNELLKPDIDIFIEKLNNLKIDYNYFEYYNQCHNFAIYPTKEAKNVINDVVNIIEQDI